jgi:hypothetical protein
MGSSDERPSDNVEQGTTWIQFAGSSVWHTIDPWPTMTWPRGVTICGLGLKAGEHPVVGYSGGKDCQNCAKRTTASGSSIESPT